MMTYGAMIECIGNGIRPITAARIIFGKPKPSWACQLRNYCWNQLTYAQYHNNEEYRMIADRIYAEMPADVKLVADTLTYE